MYSHPGKWLGGTPVCCGLPIRLLHLGRLVTIIFLTGCVWFAIILHLFLSIRGNSSFVVPLHLEADFSVHFTYHKELPTQWMTFPLKPNIWMSAKNTTGMRKILTRCFSLNDARTD